MQMEEDMYPPMIVCIVLKQTLSLISIYHIAILHIRQSRAKYLSEPSAKAPALNCRVHWHNFS